MSPHAHHPASITDVSAAWPTMEELARALTLQAGFNPTVVTLGTTLLGVAAGIVGVFAVLRKRALMCDALSHATLPGICLAFLIAGVFGWEGRSLGLLLTGAAASAILGVLAVHAIKASTRLTEDAAIGIVLSVFFGVGVVLLSLIQSLESGNQGGLKSFIYGQTAAMHASDVAFMAALALVAACLAALFLKELSLVCFDDTFARVSGWPVTWIDLLTMAMIVLVTVAGLQAVGLILVIALLIIPPAAARLWSDRLTTTLLASAFIGGASGYLGSVASYLLPRLPAGSVIVLVAGAVFLVSLLFAPRRGVIAGVMRRAALNLRVTRDHAVRTLLEQGPLTTADLTRFGVGSRLWVAPIMWALARRGDTARSQRRWSLTDRGRRDAARLERNHRLWEQYLMQHADVAASHVDWSADAVEHVLSPQLIAELERTLASSTPSAGRK